MPNAPDPWFVTERSEALAGLLLTARSDVRILKKTQLDDRLVFHVSIGTGDPTSARLFIAQVKGTMVADPSEWATIVEPWFSHPDQPVWLPMCVIVVDVRENNAVYSWLAEPRVEDDTAVLKSSLSPAFQPLDAAAVNAIVDQVKSWYAALPRQLQPA